MMTSLADLLEPSSERHPFLRSGVCLVETVGAGARAFIACIEERDAGTVLHVVDEEAAQVVGDFSRTGGSRSVVVYHGFLRGRATELRVDWDRRTAEARVAAAAPRGNA